MKLLRRIVSSVAAVWHSGRFKQFRVGKGTDILTWRIRAQRDCHLTVGSRCFVRSNVVFERSGARLSVGDRTFLGHGLIAIAESVDIGSDVMLAWGVTVVDHNSHSLRISERRHDTELWLRGRKDWSTVHIAEVKIHDKAWIGFDAIILKGVVIGEGAIVAAGAVVSKSVPPWTIVAGNPARIVRELSEDER